MSTTTRNVLLALVALAVAVGAFVLLQPDDDDEPAGAQTTTATVTVTGNQPTTTTTPPTTTTTTTTVKATVIPTRGGSPVGDIAEIEVDKDDNVRIDVTSDVAEEVHVHGYDIESEIPAGGAARLRFRAKIDGRFEIELHGSGEQIGELTVNP